MFLGGETEKNWVAQGLAVIQGKSLQWFEFGPGCVALDLLAILLQENHSLLHTVLVGPSCSSIKQDKVVCIYFLINI